MAEKRKFACAIPRLQVSRQAERMKPRSVLETRNAAGARPLVKGSRNEQANYTLAGGESQEVLAENLEKVLEKDYVPRKELSGVLANVMSDFQNDDYGDRIALTRSYAVEYTPVLPPPEKSRTEPGNVPLVDFRSHREIHISTQMKNPCLMLYRDAEKVSCCGDWLKFGCTPQGVKLVEASFCKHRLCPMCNWRRGAKVFSQLKQILEYLREERYRYIAVTLSVKNVSGGELSGAIEAMLSGWRNLVNNDKVFGRGFWRKWRGQSPVVQGIFRSLEITLNEETDMFHPHFHALLAVDSSYYKSDYHSTQEWSQAWKSACGLDYDPVVWAQAVDKKTGTETDFSRVVWDVSKADTGLSKIRVPVIECCEVDDGIVSYISKSGEKYAIQYDFLSRTDDDELRKKRVYALYTALRGRRLISFQGVFRQVRKDLGLTDPETDLVDDSVARDGDIDSDVLYFTALWKYGTGGYKIVRVKE